MVVPIIETSARCMAAFPVKGEMASVCGSVMNGACNTQVGFYLSIIHWLSYPAKHVFASCPELIF